MMFLDRSLHIATKTGFLANARRYCRYDYGKPFQWKGRDGRKVITALERCEWKLNKRKQQNN